MFNSVILPSNLNFKYTAAFVLAFSLHNAAYAEDTDVNSPTYIYKVDQYSLALTGRYQKFSQNYQRYIWGFGNLQWHDHIYRLDQFASFRTGLGNNIELGIGISNNSRNHVDETEIDYGRVYTSNKANYLSNPIIYIGYGLDDFINGPLKIKIRLTYSPNIKDNSYGVIEPSMNFSYPLNKEFLAYSELNYTINQKYDQPDSKSFSIGLRNYSFSKYVIDASFKNLFINNSYEWSSYQMNSASIQLDHELFDNFYVSPKFVNTWTTYSVTKYNLQRLPINNMQTYSIQLKKMF